MGQNTQTSTEEVNKNTQQETTTVNNGNQEAKTKEAKKKMALFLIILIIIGISYGLYWFLYGRFLIKTEDAYITGNQNAVTSQVAGTVKDIYVQNTQQVKKGQLLAVIDDTNYKIALENAKANLGKTVRAYANLSTNVQSSKDAVDVAQTQLSKAQISYKMDEQSYRAGLISKHQFEISKNNLKIAKLDLERANKALEEAKTQATSKTIYTHPDIQQGIAMYKNAYVNLLRTKIYAPESGVVALKSVYLGQQVAPSQQLMTILDLENVWVDANYKETQLKDIKVGNKVKIYSDVTEKTYDGYVVGISGGSGSALSLLPAQNATGNWIKIVQRIPVRVVFEKDSIKKNGTIPIGSSITTTIHVKDSVDEVEEFPGVTTDLYNIDEQKLQDEINEIVSENLIKN